MLLKSKIFFSGIAAFFLGISAFYFQLDLFFSLLFFSAIFLFLTIFQNKKNSTIAIFFLPFFALGFFRMSLTEHIPDASADIDFYNNSQQISTIDGYVYSFPEDRLESQSFDFSVYTKDELGVSGLIKIYAPHYPELDFAQILTLKCKLKSPQNFEDFDFKNYLAKNNIYSVCYYPEIFSTADFHSDFRTNFLSIFYKIRKNFIHHLQQIFPEPQSSIITALLTGDKYSIPKNISTDFSHAGVSHLLALSGLHIALLLLFSELIFSFLPHRPKIISQIILLISFAFFAGLSPSILRATIMGVLMLLAILNYRKINILQSLLLAAFVILLINPKLLFYDVSFQLSFLATLGIIFLSPILKSFLKFLPNKFKIKEIFAITLSAQIFVLPVVIWNFQTISLISPIANLFLLPVLPVIMLSGFLAGLLSYFSIFIAKIFGVIAYLTTTYMLKITELFSAIPFAYLEINLKSPIFILAYYTILFTIIFLFRQHDSYQH